MFFCVSAMLSDEKRMVLNLGQHVPRVRVPAPGQASSLGTSGRIDYTILTVDHHKHRAFSPSVHLIELRPFAESFITSSLFSLLRQQNPNGLFVAEGKLGGALLVNRVTQVLAEMYTSAKHLRKSVIRGALTDRHDWIFLVLYLNEDGVGGAYFQSPTIKMQVSSNYPYSVLSPGPDIIAGILAYWVERSFVGIDEHDWFTRQITSVRIVQVLASNF
ncbi:hypothetical protein BDM02DRAFT_3193961 [Thelephora ganbajun]|uniref:Uncharacterized protein n=1 Tax=Thelephora ganbajun TaxID=370292 RepID=A0ACB6YXS1_THEGA|nr:hypothetical protein BDM02DRAFT_3193961 [Thelephora ganbajun]